MSRRQLSDFLVNPAGIEKAMSSQPGSVRDFAGYRLYRWSSRLRGSYPLIPTGVAVTTTPTGLASPAKPAKEDFGER